MDAALYTLMLVLAASGLDGTQVLVSIPEGTIKCNNIIPPISIMEGEGIGLKLWVLNDMFIRLL